MKYRHLFIMFLLFLAHQATAQVPNWTWARGSRDPVGPSHTLAMSIAADNFGNEYITGGLESNYNIVGADTFFKACGGFSDAFLVKYDAAGNVLWAKGMGGTNSGAEGYSVKTDLAGNVFITGAFEHGTAIFGTDTLTNDSLYWDMFIAKFDPSGNALWARKTTSPNLSVGYSVATDSLGNVYLVGMFAGAAVTIGSFTLTSDSPAYGKIFIVKYDPAGNVVWAQSPRGFPCNVWNIASDGRNIFVTGSFATANIIFGTDTLHTDSARTGDICVVKFDPSGAVLWAKSANGKQNDYANGLATPVSDYLYVTGYFQSDTFRFGSVTLTSDSPGAQLPTMFLAKYSSLTGNVVWAVKPNSSWCMATGIATDMAGDPYVTGHFASANAVFGSDTLFSMGSFVAKYDGSGNAIWAKGGGYFQRFSNAVALDPAGSIYLTGEFNGASILVLGADTVHGSPAGGGDLFVAKLSDVTATTGLSNVFKHQNDMAVFPVPNDGIMSVACAGSGYTAINIYDGLGRKIFTQPLDPAIRNQVSKVNIGHVPKGIYLLQAISPEGAVNKQILIQSL